MFDEAIDDLRIESITDVVVIAGVDSDDEYTVGRALIDKRELKRCCCC